MGILSHPLGLPLVLKTIDRLECHEKCLQLGYLKINARLYHLTKAFNSCSKELKQKLPFGCFKEIHADEVVPNELIFQNIFKENHVVDNYLHKSKRLRATIKHDMNYPMDLKYHNSYDLVIDSGTSEHVFNYAQVLMNISQCAKVNGFVYHSVPANGWLEHGFTQVSAEMLISWYESNGFEVIEAFYSRQSPTINYYSRESLEPEAFQIIDLIKSDQDGIKSFINAHDNQTPNLITEVFIVAKKIANVGEFKFPQQGEWAAHWVKNGL